MLDPWALSTAILAFALVLHFVHSARRERILGQRIASSNAALTLAIAYDRRRRMYDQAPPGQGTFLP